MLKGCGVVLAACFLTSPVVAGEDSSFTVMSGLDYSSGEFGQGKHTETAYVPFGLKYEASPWTLRLTVPYIQTRGAGGVVGRGTDSVVLGTSSRGRAEGLGDIVAGVSWTAYRNGGFLLDLTGKVKLATGDEKAGLGTGKNDYSIQADLYQTFGAHTIFGTLGFRKMGDPQGTDFRDPFYTSLGWSFRAAREVSVGVSYDYRQPLLTNGVEISESTAFVTWKFDPVWKMQTYVVSGFSKASPDMGGGVMLFRTY